MKFTEKDLNGIRAKVEGKKFDELTYKEWVYVSTRLDFYCLVNDKFINKYANKINWAYYTWNCSLSSNIIKKYGKYFDTTAWQNVTDRWFSKSYRGFKEIDDYIDQIDWTRLCRVGELSEDFMRMHADYLDWKIVSRWQKMSAAFLNEFKDKIDWEQINSNKNVKTADLNKVQDNLEVSRRKLNKNIYTRKVDEKIIEKNIDGINWTELSMSRRKFTNEFLKQNFNKIKWYYYIRQHQIDEEILKLVLENKMITKGEVEEFKDQKNSYYTKEQNRGKKFCKMIKNYTKLVKKLDEDRDYYEYNKN